MDTPLLRAPDERMRLDRKCQLERCELHYVLRSECETMNSFKRVQCPQSLLCAKKKRLFSNLFKYNKNISIVSCFWDWHAAKRSSRAIAFTGNFQKHIWLLGTTSSYNRFASPKIVQQQVKSHLAAELVLR